MVRDAFFSFLLLACFSYPLLSHATDQDATSFEHLIHDRIYSYPFRSDNLLKLATYCEMKGEYHLTHDELHMQFGGLGEISFYERHCVLRNYRGGIFHLDLGKVHHRGAEGMNHALDVLFEQIPLMGNYQADLEKIRFIDQHLADKNFEPFDKLYLRHLLILYGKWAPAQTHIELHSQWLPERLRKGPEEMPPLLIRLYPSILRGYYVKIGGTVYVEQRYMDGKYATGESSKPNVTAFKSFLQKLFQHSIHFIRGTESQRLNREIAFQAKQIDVQGKKPVFQQVIRPHTNPLTVSPTPKVMRTAHDPNGWMIMVLNLLRSNRASIADPDILPYFKDADYFPRLYELMNAEERRRVDRQLKRMGRGR